MCAPQVRPCVVSRRNLRRDLISTLAATHLVAAVLLPAWAAPSLAQDAISAPATKSIGVAKPQMVPSLIVLNAGGATLSGDTLTLKDVAATRSSSPTVPSGPPAMR